MSLVSEYSRNLKKGLKILWITFWKFYFHIYFSRAKTADLITDALEFMYIPWPDSSNIYALRSQLVNVLSDLMFFAPSHEVAAIQSHVSPVYMFEFAHRSKVTFGSEWMGVVHANNIMYDFGVRLTKTWACLSWPCTQTLPERVIRHHNQSAVLRWRSLTLVTELIWRLNSVLRWRHRFILDECPFGMIIIPNWSKWSLMMRKSTQTELALASAWDCFLLSYQSLFAHINARHSSTFAKNFSPNEMSGLDPVIFLANAAKVMMTMHLWWQVGLCNGATGILRHIIYDNNHHPPDLPVAVIVDFDNYRDPAFIDAQPSYVPIYAL